MKGRGLLHCWPLSIATWDPKDISDCRCFAASGRRSMDSPHHQLHVKLQRSNRDTRTALRKNNAQKDDTKFFVARLPEAVGEGFPPTGCCPTSVGQKEMDTPWRNVFFHFANHSASTVLSHSGSLVLTFSEHIYTSTNYKPVFNAYCPCGLDWDVACRRGSLKGETRLLEKSMLGTWDSRMVGIWIRSFLILTARLKTWIPD